DVWMRGYNGVSFARLVDARYRFTGIVKVVFDVRNQPFRRQLIVYNSDFIREVEPAPADPFAAPVKTVRSLANLGPQERPDHRVHLRGIISRAGIDGELTLTDGTGEIVLSGPALDPVQPGDSIEAVGFISKEALRL